MHVLQYVWWAGKTDLDTFWTDSDVKQLFKNHIDFMTSHVNMINGKSLTVLLLLLPAKPSVHQ